MTGGQSLVYVGLTVYWAVLVAELIGDKTIYTVTSLAVRFPPAIVFAAIVCAYSVKMAVAALLGNLFATLPANELAIVSTSAFFLSALMIGIRRGRGERPAPLRWQSGAAACFTSLFFTEWGDPAQFVAAACSARFHAPLTVWLAGTVAMMTKGGLVLAIGLQLRNRVPQQLLQRLATVTLLFLGAISLAELVRMS